MSVRVSTRNLLAGCQEGDIIAPVLAPGYVSTDLVRGDLGQACVTSSDSGDLKSRFDFDFLVPVGSKITFAALFDVRAYGAAISSASVSTSTTWGGTWISAGQIPLSSRGDGCVSLVEARTARGVRISIILTGLGYVRVGLPWVGEHQDLSRSYARRRNAPEFGTLTNEFEQRNVRTYELADYIERFDLGWGRLTEAQVAEHVQIFRALRGGLLPLVLLLDRMRTPSTAYHGRIQVSMPHDVDWPEHTGIAWRFTESGRGLDV